MCHTMRMTNLQFLTREQSLLKHGSKPVKFGSDILPTIAVERLWLVRYPFNMSTDYHLINKTFALCARDRTGQVENRGWFLIWLVQLLSVRRQSACVPEIKCKHLATRALEMRIRRKADNELMKQFSLDEVLWTGAVIGFNAQRDSSCTDLLHVQYNSARISIGKDDLSSCRPKNPWTDRRQIWLG